MAVDPVDGSVNLVFLDRRHTDGRAQGVTVARSTDGGRTFRNLSVNQPPFTCPETVFYGDYLGIDAYGGRVVAAWPHCLPGEGLVLSAAVFEGL
jgi:hypothetical protein